ncbi:uncharacterized protein LOC120358002 [Solenopsis invicta]|uniref:uncharacterized protein LOC120358002 n=1 Tax=Solenopsis invicta TaxID=13686 RepID=UPI00193C9504|nr:uncharacterized protein LOC120358002 [Solenopsis invicta]
MLFYTLTISAFSFVAFGLSANGEFTLPFPTCKRNSPDISNCLVQAIQEAWPLICKGIPELDFPPMDPIFIKNGSAKLNLADLHGKLIFKNMTIIGLSKMRFYNVTAHLNGDDPRLQIYGMVPSVYIETIAKVNGGINVFRIFGEDYFNETLTDVRGPWDLSGPVINDTWIIKHFRVLPSIGNLNVYFDTLIKTQGKEFNDFIVNLVNQFWPTFYRHYQSILPIVADLYEHWLIEFPNKIFSKIPFSEIFP